MITPGTTESGPRTLADLPARAVSANETMQREAGVVDALRAEVERLRSVTTMAIAQPPVPFASVGDLMTPREADGVGAKVTDGLYTWAQVLSAAAPAATVVQPHPPIGDEFTATARDALAWVLWHHLGGSSPVGQPIRFALGMGAHEKMSEHQIAGAKRWANATGSATEDFHRAKLSAQPPAQDPLTDPDDDPPACEPTDYVAPRGRTG